MQSIPDIVDMEPVLMKWLLIIVLLSAPCWGACTAAVAAPSPMDWMTGGNWSGCLGTGGIPASTDAITTLNGKEVTCASASCTALSVVAGNATSEIHVLSGGTVNIVGTGLTTVNFNTPGNSIVVDAGGTFHACGGGATVRATCLNVVGNATTQSVVDVSGTFIMDQGWTMGLNSLFHMHCGSTFYGSGTNPGYQLTPGTNWTTPFAKVWLDCTNGWGTIPNGTNAVTACHAAPTYGIICWDGNLNNPATVANNYQFSGPSGALLTETHSAIIINAGTTSTAVFGFEGQAWTGDHVLFYGPGQSSQHTANNAGTPSNVGAAFNMDNLVFRTPGGTVNANQFVANDGGAATGTAMVCNHCYWDTATDTTALFNVFASNFQITNSVWGSTMNIANTPNQAIGTQMINDIIYQSKGSSKEPIIGYGGSSSVWANSVVLGNSAATGNLHGFIGQNPGTAGGIFDVCHDLIFDGGGATINQQNGYAFCNGVSDRYYNNFVTRESTINNGAGNISPPSYYGTAIVNHTSAYNLGDPGQVVYTVVFFENRSGESTHALGDFSGNIIDGTPTLVSRCVGSNTTICSPSTAATCSVDTTANPAVSLSSGNVTVAMTGCDGTNFGTIGPDVIKFNHFVNASWLNGVFCENSTLSPTSVTCALIPPYTSYPNIPSSYSGTETTGGKIYVGPYLGGNALANLGTGAGYNAIWNPGLNRTGYVMPAWGSITNNFSMQITNIATAPSDTQLTVTTATSTPSVGDWLSCSGDTNDNSVPITAVTGTAPNLTITYNATNSVGGIGLSHTTDCIAGTKTVKTSYPLYNISNGEYYGSGEGRGTTDLYSPSVRWRAAGKYQQDFDPKCGGPGTTLSMYQNFQAQSHWDLSAPPLFVTTPNPCYNLQDLQEYYWWNYTSMNPSLAHSAPDGTDMGIQGRVFNVMVVPQ